VRLDGAPINTTLPTPPGTVVAEELSDTTLVRLDSPAIDHNEDGTERRLKEVRALSSIFCPSSNDAATIGHRLNKDVAGIFVTKNTRAQ
jgi:hypothetical protein